MKHTNVSTDKVTLYTKLRENTRLNELSRELDSY